MNKSLKIFFVALAAAGASMVGYGSALASVVSADIKDWSQVVWAGVGEQTFTFPETFNAFSVQPVWDDTVQYSVRIEDRWGVPQDADEPELFIVNPTREITFRTASPVALRIDFIDSGAGEVATFAPALSAKRSWDFSDYAKAGIDIITRPEWGAEESYTWEDPDYIYPADTGETASEKKLRELKELYPEDFKISNEKNKDDDGHALWWPWAYSSKIKKIVVHHTASVSDLSDPAAALRAIYHYHAVSRGWGDVGYNFIIDTQGRVYEGRAGGDAVVGGHAQYANVSTIGISIMGNYQDMDVSDVSEQGLAKLIAYLSAKYKLSPLGIGIFHGQSLPNIIGHRDIGATACPGEHLYALLPRIREKAAALLGGLGEVSAYNFEIQGTLPYLTIDPTMENTIAIKLKNTGKEKWGAGTKLTPLATTNTVFASLSQSELLEPEVGPGEVGTFMTTVRAGIVQGAQHITLALQVNSSNTTEKRFTMPVKVNATKMNYAFVSAKYPKKSLVPYETTTATVAVKNTSNFRWQKNGDYEVRLSGTVPQDRRSKFIAAPEQVVEDSQYDEPTDFDPRLFGTMKEDEVLPGATAHFEINLTAPEEFGSFSEHFTLHAPKIGWFPDNGMRFDLTVRPPLASAELIGKAPTLNYEVAGGDRITLKFKLKNTGELIWRNGKIKFASDNIDFPVVSTVYKSSIYPDKTGDFLVTLQAPYKQGSAITRIKLQSSIKNHSFTVQPDFLVTAKVKTTSVFRAKLISKNVQTLKMQPWEERTIEVKIQNTGTVAWHNTGGVDGRGVFMLGTSGPRNRTGSAFQTPRWLKLTRPGTLKEETVKPGETGTLVFLLRAPGKAGTYKESFEAVVDYVGWLSGTTITFEVKVGKKGATPDVSESTSTTPPTSTTSTTTATTTAVSNTTSNATVTSSNEPKIRILLSKANGSEVQITSSKSFTAQKLDGTKIKSYAAGEVATFVNGKLDSKSYDGVRFVGDILQIKNYENRPSWNKALNDNSFRGVLEVRSYNNKWVVIDELPMESYLLGLAEVPESDPVEKHKAVLVGARTYALWYLKSEDKFPGAPYDGSDDPNVFQKYLGYGYESRAPKHVSVVKGTSGMVVYYQDKLVKTPYFNSSDGKTRSAKEVWGWTNTPYLISVDDSACNDKVLRGHGVGLSGCGATGMANKGSDYKAILKHYYTGVEVKKAY